MPLDCKLFAAVFSHCVLILQEADLDCICISPKANPPVCKLVNFHKFLYDLKHSAKSEKAKKMKSKVQTVRTLNFRAAIEHGDFTIKIRQMRSFLQKRIPVKAAVVKPRRRLQRTEMLDPGPFLEQVKELMGNLIAFEAVSTAKSGVLMMSPRKLEKGETIASEDSKDFPVPKPMKIIKTITLAEAEQRAQNALLRKAALSRRVQKGGGVVVEDSDDEPWAGGEEVSDGEEPP